MKGVAPGGKVIRDPIHGDIFVENRFLKIIDTREFQRLRRIRQLSTADLLFPSATHTRFAHSLGTFHIMRSIIKHFEEQLSDMNLYIAERDKNLALAAALLHDIGHGPYSHAFEGIIPKYKFKRHEEWTQEIITSQFTEVNKVLRETFDQIFARDVANLISKTFYNSKNVKSFSSIDLSNIISSLVSSQIDADRMDYLLRDSFYTGVCYGNFDLARLIKSFRINVDNLDNLNYSICILDKYVSNIEEYLLSRYQMHKEIYYHEFKVEMEELLRKIFQRAYELFINKKLNEKELPAALRCAFKGNKIKVEDYIELDDVSILSLIQSWKTKKDIIMATLCRSFLDRRKYLRLGIRDNSLSSIEEFKTRLLNVLKDNGYKITDLDKEYFWISTKIKGKSIYNKDEDTIWVLCSNGIVKNLSSVSNLLGEVDEKFKRECKHLCFINMELLQHITNNNKEVINEIERIIHMYDTRNYVEIEKKYILNSQKVFSKVEKALKKWEAGYNVQKIGFIEQRDVYYDTPDNKLYKNNITLRIRQKQNKNFLTIKTPTIESNDRFEYEKELDGEQNLIKYKDFILRYIDFISEKDIELLQESVIIENKRQEYKIQKERVVLEMVFDDVDYLYKENKKHEYQIEIELKSDYPHKVILGLLTDYLEREIDELVPIHESKYKRAVKAVLPLI